MSLDVYLVAKEPIPVTGSGIYIREDGQNKEISVEEWNKRNPDREPIVCKKPEKTTEVFHANITHNMNQMANAAGCYKELWRPEDIGITKAEQLIVPLAKALANLMADPERFRKLEPANKWGTYDGLVKFVADYLTACNKYPQAEVKVWA